MKNKLTTVQQIKRNKIIKRVICGIILVVSIPSIFLYCYNYINNYFEELKSSVSIKTISKNNKTKTETNNETANGEDIAIHKKEDEEKTLNSLTDKQNDSFLNSDNNVNISSGSNYDKDISTNSVPEFFHHNKTETDNENDKSYSSDTAQNNPYFQQTEELNDIKNNYNKKVNDINNWYSNEFDANYKLMIESENEYKSLGGYATETDKSNALIKLKNAEQEMADKGFVNSGYASSYKKQLQDEYNQICKRYSYSQKYDEYYNYIYNTLPVEKDKKLAVVTEEYNNDLKNYRIKYNL